MKRRTKVVALATSLLVGVSMIGVGFATWVISKDMTETVSGNVTAETVRDDALDESDFSLGSSTGQSIHFGKPSTTDIENAWLTNDDGIVENLTVEFTLTVSANVGKIVIEFSSDDEGWTTATGAGYISDTVTFNYSDEADDDKEYFNVDDDTDNKFTLTKNEDADWDSVSGGTVEITITATFAWGAAFGGENPYDFFNGSNHKNTDLMSEFGEEFAEDGDYNDYGSIPAYQYAEQALTGLYEAIYGSDSGEESQVQYNFTFTVTHA